jgi:uncharacterized protein (TIGR02646 family)
MRWIKKSRPPKLLRDWIAKADQLTDFNYDYGLNSYPEAKKEVHDQLVVEQYFLCAYSGVEITSEKSHIEHLKPRNKCERGEDVDYLNLLACFPVNGGDETHGFGAPFKKGWWDPANFVCPLDKNCERRFSYSWSGKMKPAANADKPASETIKKLRLDSKGIVKYRLKAIKGFFGFVQGREPISLEEAAQLLSVIDRPNKSGRLTPFCFVLKQLLVVYIDDKKKKQKPPRKKR